MYKTVIAGVLALVSVCASPVMAQDHTDIVRATKARLEAQGVNLSGQCGAFQITGRVAWALRTEGWGLISKNPGQNGCDTPQGRFAVDALLKQDGSVFVDLLINSETDNTPAWQVREVNNTAGWAAPFDLGGAPDAPPPPGPGPTPIPNPGTSAEHDAIVDLMGDLQAQMADFRKWAEIEIAAVRAEHKAQQPPLDKVGKSPIWQIILAALSAIGATYGATK